MAFRADEAAENGFEQARKYLIGREVDPAVRPKAETVLRDIVSELGPVVDCYPTWHPLVSQHDPRNPERFPSERTGYVGLDHTVCFAHGFVTCPYGNVQEVLDSVRKLNTSHVAEITAESLHCLFYNGATTSILVRCDWHSDLDPGHLIPKRLAVPLMLEQELPCWRWAQRAESWETMRPYLLGEPHGQRSSLFVSQDTTMALKKAYMTMVDSGMFGPVKSH